jgi:hypothetical protein
VDERTESFCIKDGRTTWAVVLHLAFWPELPKVGDVHYSTILIFNPDFASTPILLVLIHFADLLRRIAMNGVDRLTVGISGFYEPTHMHVLRLDTLS